MSPKVSALNVMLVDSGNIIKCKQLTKQLYDSLADEMVESTRHCLASLVKGDNNKPLPLIEFTHENHSSLVDNNERDQIRICVKVFISHFQENVLRQAVQKALSHLGVSRIDSLILSFPHSGNAKIELAQIQPLWTTCEDLIANGTLGSAGVSDLDLTQLMELHTWAPNYKPSTNQLNMDLCSNLSSEMTAFAADNNIQLLSHADDVNLTSKQTVSRILNGYRDDIEDWSCEWISRYTVMYKCRGVLTSKGYIVKLTNGELRN
jgi:glutamate--cysteine ligase regulatory subunit